MNSPSWNARASVVCLSLAAIAAALALDDAAHATLGSVAAARMAASLRPRANTFPAEELLALVRERSVHRHLVDWDVAGPEFLDRIRGATDDAGRAAAVTSLLARMNDVHSTLLLDGRAHAHYEGLDEEVRRRVLPVLERSRSQTNRPTATMLDGRWGYVLVPSMAPATPEEIERLARNIRTGIAEIAAQRPIGWIVDLRLNGGGHVYPMLVGLAPLLGEGVVGGTVDADGKSVHEWLLRPDGLYWRDGAGDRRFAALDLPVALAEPTPPVAVLVGPVTGSSGEATALAFKGRPRCVLVGEPTAKGYTTVLNPFQLDASTTLSLAVGFMTDRHGVACTSQVVPDIAIAGEDAFDDPAADPKVAAAIAWLRGEAILRPCS